ncbi:YkvA family protein [uncultured Anaerococcus sp.]|uniref:YkvA family protein n=1 Tax=uncultured Anaerococcus sp. TaxID=293428 RepID=UPI00261E0C7B|nr:DUF1232 domain-containing protein [uncultured Anaerococcus sp.]
MNKLRKIKNFIPLYFRAMKNKNTPKSAKIVGLIAIIYAILPIDIIPDSLPILGILDDATIFSILIYLAGKMIANENNQEAPILPTR